MARREQESKAATGEDAVEQEAQAREVVPVEADPQADKQASVKFPRERLIEEAQAFLGVPSYVVAGALAETDDEELTLNAARKHIDTWAAAPAHDEGE
jgi:hypothetical protein